MSKPKPTSGELTDAVIVLFAIVVALGVGRFMLWLGSDPAVTVMAAFLAMAMAIMLAVLVWGVIWSIRTIIWMLFGRDS